MTDGKSAPDSAKTHAAKARATRRAVALRANLRRRKEQHRARTDAEAKTARPKDGADPKKPG